MSSFYKTLFIVSAIFFSFFVSTFFFSSQLVAEGTYSNLGTSDAADGSNDAINFSQGRVWTIDQYGKYIWLTQARGSTSHWAWSNNSGANWSQGSESYSFLTRGSVAYDSINDVLHVIWEATDDNDGIIYRRYSITRDGSNNITAISRVDSGTVNLQLDTSASRSLNQPVALWINDGSADGVLVAIWSKSGSSLNEVRGSMRKLSMTGADGTAGNWVALDGTGDTFATDPPAVAADKIFGDTTGTNASSANVREGTGSRKDDLYVFVAESDDSSADTILGYRAIWNSSSLNWSGGWQSPVTVGAMDTSSGYSLKEQLITKPVLDPNNDRLYVGWARWVAGGDGDTVSFAYLNSTDTASSTFDAYSALGTHSYAPTLDIAFDETLGNFYVSYIESTTNGTNGSIDYKIFDGTTLGTQTRFYTSPGGSAGADGSADIPILFENRSNNRLLFGFRINGALPPTALDPHTIDWGYITLANPTSTPTPTNTPAPTNTPTPTPTPTTTQSNSTPAPPSCTNQAPSGTPDLFQIDVTSTNMTLYFTPVTSASNYYVSYGVSSGSEQFGAELQQGSSEGVLSYTINSLTPQTTYYVRIRGGNGCMPGNWSNEMVAKTVQKGSLQTNSHYKNIISHILSVLPKKTTVLGTTTKKVVKKPKGKTSCTYTIQSGDTLWDIAEKQHGDGSAFKKILTRNKNVHPEALEVGSTIKICD